jgi:hypothetical protein
MTHPIEYRKTVDDAIAYCKSIKFETPVYPQKDTQEFITSID